MSYTRHLPTAWVRFPRENFSIRVPVATTQEERTKGLLGRTSLEMNEGLLFLVPDDGLAMTMREMMVPLDFIFIEGSKIVGIRPMVPAGFLDPIVPNVRTKWVLEMPAGWASGNRIYVGDTVDVQLRLAIPTAR